MKILHVCTSLSGPGDDVALGEATASLARVQGNQGHDVRIVLPRDPLGEADAPAQGADATAVTVALGGRELRGEVRPSAALDVPGVRVFVVAQDELFTDPPPALSPGSGRPAREAVEAAFQALASIRSLRAWDWCPDVIHCWGYRTALVPAYLRLRFYGDPWYAWIPVVYSFADLRERGVFPSSVLAETGLADQLAASVTGFAFSTAVDFTRIAAQFADWLTTSSPHYAASLVEENTISRDLHGTFAERRGDLSGIVPGVDTREWDPEHDPHLAARFTADDPSGKGTAKADLQQRLGLTPDPRQTLVGVLGPLTEEHGATLLLEALPGLARLEVQTAVVGTGAAEVVERLHAAAQEHPSVTLVDSDDPGVEHRLLAGADLLVRPGRARPASVVHLRGLRYGTLPVAPPVGTIVDTVRPYAAGRGEANGFVFREHSPVALVDAVREALAARRQTKKWRRLVSRAMREDHSWERAAQQFAFVYRKAVARSGRT